MKKLNLILIPLIAVLAGCATAPQNIAPSYVSHVTYMSWTCEQLAQEQTRLVNALSSACDSQRQARSNDTVGVIFLGLPVSSLSGSNQASNIARLKGELDAVQQALIKKDCGSEIISIEEVVAKKKNKD